MASDWNALRSEYNGQVLSWEQKDDTQKLLTMIQVETVDALNAALEYSYLLDFVDNHLSFVNKAPLFWSEAMKSMRFTTVMRAARLFDESRDAISLKKVFNKLEQSSYRNAVAIELKTCKKQYDTYHDCIEEIRTLRDKQFAHNDEKELQFWKHPREKDLEFEGEFWWKLEEMLRWARDTILTLRTLIGDGFPVDNEIRNDLSGLLPVKES